MVSIAVNVVLTVVAVALWSDRSGDGRVLIPGEGPEPVGPEISPIGLASELTSVSEWEAEMGQVVWLPFRWSQVESEDYRVYMANLRAMGCPEPLIRDMILAELHEAFRARQGSIRREPVPAWAGRDRLETVQEEYQRRLHDLWEERRAVTAELLGFEWSNDFRDEFLSDPTTVILLGHLADEKAFQAMSLFRLYQERAGWVRSRARNILLEEDWDELAALEKELRARLATTLMPGEWEETLLRIHWWEALDWQGRFQLAGLTGAETRRLTQLYTRRVDGIVESLIGTRVVTEAERADRQRQFEADWVEAFGPVKAAALRRAGDNRFHELVEFAEQRELSPETAVSVYEVRVVAEEELRRLRGDLPGDPSAIAEEIEKVQTATMEALTRLLGPGHVADYVAHAGAWLDLEGVGTARGMEVAR